MTYCNTLLATKNEQAFYRNFQIKLFCVHPVKMMMETKLEVHKDKTLSEATEMAYKVGWLIALLLHLTSLWV